jgi:type I restriction enzyme S subunit
MSKATNLDTAPTFYLDKQDSGVEWLGATPSHWAVSPVYARYHVQLGKMLDQSAVTGSDPAPYLRNQNIQWDRVDLNDLREMDFDPAERRKFALVVGDLLVCEGGDIGRTAMWRGELPECYFQKAVHRLRAFRPDQDEGRFLLYLMFAASKLGVFVAEGNRSTILHLTAEKLRRHRLPFPPIAEQREIVCFLDRETARLDGLIAKKQLLIVLLEEKRAALIAHAVTRGLNAQVRCRDSGVGWLGEIPSHWRVMKLKLVARLATGHTPSRSVPEYWIDCTIPWVSLADVGRLRAGTMDVIHDTREKISELGLANSSAELLPAKSVILSRTASVGFSAILGQPMATTQDFVNWICGPKLLPRYLLHCFRAMQPEFKRLTMGSTHQTIYMPDVAQFAIPLPPVEEQQAIDDYVRDQTSRIDALAAKLKESIERLTERRSALITAAVTGQIDVRSEAHLAS